MSDKYKQQKGSLGSLEDGFCCWGLGCYVVGLKFKNYHPWNDDFAEYVGYTRIKGDLILQNETMEHLDQLNDEKGKTFIEIGNLLIETAELNFNPEVATAITNHFKQK